MTETPKKPALDRAMVSALAKALWKADQKAADPSVDAKALSARWAELRKAHDRVRKDQISRARALIKAIAKAGYRLDKAPEKPEGKAKAAKAGKARAGG